MGKRLGGANVSRLGKSIGLKWMFLTPSTASAPLHPLQLPHCYWLLVQSARGGGGRGGAKGGEAVFKYINNAWSMQMKLPLNIILVMLSGCASWDPGVTMCMGTRRDTGQQKFPHTLAQPLFFPPTPPPPHNTHSFPPPAAQQIRWLTTCNAPGLPSTLDPLQGHELPPPSHSLHNLHSPPHPPPPPPISAIVSLLHSLVYTSLPQGWGEGLCSPAFRGKEGEELLSLTCTCAPTLCAHTSPRQQTLA